MKVDGAISLPDTFDKNHDEPTKSVNKVAFNDHHNNDSKTVTVNDRLSSIDEDKLNPYIRKKLEELESEVRRLRETNEDAIVGTLKKLQEENVDSNRRVSTDAVISQLLVDHNLLKKEMGQLKWEHDKVTQPGLLVEEMKQLRKDMDYLRKKNESLKHLTKQSSRSLNHLLSSSQHDIKESKDHFDGRSKDRGLVSVSNMPDFNNSSNYIYQKLQNNRQPIGETPNVQTMLKHNIESLESPYHTTYQNIQYAAPFTAGSGYRARKISDSSSILLEDVTPKVWVEKLPQNYNTPYHQIPHNNYQYNDNEDQSMDSYVSATTTLTERTEDDWRLNPRRGTESNNDLLSTQDSEFSDNSTVRDIPNFQTKTKLDYSFTPKMPSDLSLDDYVKFVRPGGKMSTGRVCFIGHLPGRSEVCVGLELGEDAGKHDGMFEDTRYFQWYSYWIIKCPM